MHSGAVKDAQLHPEMLPRFGTADWSVRSLCWFHFLGQFKTHCSQTLTVHKNYKCCWPQIHWREKKALMSSVWAHWATHTHTLWKAEVSVQTTLNPLKRHSGTETKQNQFASHQCGKGQDLLDLTWTTALHLWTIILSSGHTAASCFHPGLRDQLLTIHWTIHQRPSQSEAASLRKYSNF